MSQKFNPMLKALMNPLKKNWEICSQDWSLKSKLKFKKKWVNLKFQKSPNHKNQLSKTINLKFFTTISFVMTAERSISKVLDINVLSAMISIFVKNVKQSQIIPTHSSKSRILNTNLWKSYTLWKMLKILWKSMVKDIKWMDSRILLNKESTSLKTLFKVSTFLTLNLRRNKKRNRNQKLKLKLNQKLKLKLNQKLKLKLSLQFKRKSLKLRRKNLNPRKLKRRNLKLKNQSPKKWKKKSLSQRKKKN